MACRHALDVMGEFMDQDALGEEILRQIERLVDIEIVPSGEYQALIWQDCAGRPGQTRCCSAAGSTAITRGRSIGSWPSTSGTVTKSCAAKTEMSVICVPSFRWRARFELAFPSP